MILRLSSDRQPPGFIPRFALCMGLLILGFSRWESFFGSVYLYPISFSAASLLNLLGVHAVLDTSFLAQGFCALETERELFHVQFECTGIFSLFVYLGAVAVYPASLRYKLLGALTGIPAFFVYSTLRITALGLIGHLTPRLLDFCHIYLMVLLNLGFFLFSWSLWVNHSPLVSDRKQ